MESESPKSTNARHYGVLKARLDKYLASGTASDVLIIKTHLICEYYLNQILILKDICTASQIEDLTFYKKLEKALDRSNKFEMETFIGLGQLNKLRNKVGHELEYALSESDLDKLGLFEGKEYLIKKYEFDSHEETLIYVLRSIGINMAVILQDVMEKEKAKLVVSKKT